MKRRTIRDPKQAAAEPVAASGGPMPALPRIPLTAGQVRAIYDVMRTFRDDDLSRTDLATDFVCARCGRSRPPAGSLVYGELRLCNGCATDYELLRTAGMERDMLLPDGS